MVCSKKLFFQTKLRYPSETSKIERTLSQQNCAERNPEGRILPLKGKLFPREIQKYRKGRKTYRKGIFK